MICKSSFFFPFLFNAGFVHNYEGPRPTKELLTYTTEIYINKTFGRYLVLLSGLSLPVSKQVDTIIIDK